MKFRPDPLAREHRPPSPSPLARPMSTTQASIGVRTWDHRVMVGHQAEHLGPRPLQYRVDSCGGTKISPSVFTSK